MEDANENTQIDTGMYVRRSKSKSNNKRAATLEEEDVVTSLVTLKVSEGNSKPLKNGNLKRGVKGVLKIARGSKTMDADDSKLPSIRTRSSPKPLCSAIKYMKEVQKNG
ncbi:uncharacterized protein [Rutidosis leptorrhynchoides]|uniref:uncharacterized protein n=1 Tax=Rutidosis leptorrhynchoides TaxID=125765 RepID=UPI003A996AB3